MYILDLTSLLKGQDDASNPNIFYCNNCLLHWKDNLYIMSYRRIEFHTTVDGVFHPWKLWDNAYKYLYPDPERLYLCVNSAKRHGDYKFRHRLSPDIVVALDAHPPGGRIPTGLREFDGTGLAILRYTPDDPTGSWHVVKNILNVFGKDMNQDARLYHGYKPNEFFITYNSFILRKNEKRVVMMVRRFLIVEHGTLPTFLYFYEEEELLHHPHRSIEKNCIRHANNETLYSISDGRLCIHKDTHVAYPSNPLLEQLDKLFQPYGILFSLGSNTMPYRDNYLALGHLKLPFRSLLKAGSYPENIRSFLESIDFNTVYAHGKYIYMMVIFEFDTAGTIRRISNAFIPTTHCTHLPYLLCFPMGITYGRNEDEILISYGEGDVRCKIWSLTTENMENLLSSQEELCNMLAQGGAERDWAPPRLDFRFELLDTHEFDKRPKIYHYGYYFEENAGDDMFALVFRLLQKAFAPNAVTRFRNSFHPRGIKDSDLLLFGGGDIITSYFINDIARWSTPHKKHAISIGVPFHDYFTCLEYFDTILLRNPLDITRVRDMFPKKLVEYYPDLGFLLPRIFPRDALLLLDPILVKDDPGIVAVGVSIPRTCYQKHSMDYLAFLESIVQLLGALLEQDDRIHLYLIPFCLLERKHNENDRVFNAQVHEMMLCHYHGRVNSIDLDPWGTGNFVYVKTIYRLVSEMDFMICGRFHSHIFALASGVPFFSVSWTRKCHELMSGYGLAEYMICIDTNTDDRPVGILDLPSATERLVATYNARDTIRETIKMLYESTIMPQCTEFLHFWKTFMDSHFHPCPNGPPLSPPSS